MIKCSVCEIEKDESKFQTYWHSTQNAMRIRKQCTECFYKIRLKKKNPDKYYEQDPNYRKCRICAEWKTMDNYYIQDKKKNQRYHKCKKCQNSQDREKNRSEREIYLAESCGSERIPIKPNTYADQYQKACAFNILEVLGYTFDEPSGIWIKPGFKEVVNGRAYFPMLIKKRAEYGSISSKRPPKKMTRDIYDKIFILRDQGLSYREIGLELNISITTVSNYINGKEVKWKDTSE